MPLNTLRLNHAPSAHPNDRIVFIKPLPRPAHQQKDYETADLLLRAIAAQCLPIMKSNYLSVTTLEEYEPNPEFVGRNFNNGEIIQLVLRSKNGSWMSVRMIQMVMMHELAHNLQMNHSKKFWEVRNKFADEMRALWARGYTGDGLWGGGRVLGNLEGNIRGLGGFVSSEQIKDLPLCGGTFRSRGRGKKRKKTAGTELTWKERKQRRIEKKFGKDGTALGEDEDKRLSLEGLGRGPLGVKPRVAQSKRGRELRAAAALARFQTNKQELDKVESIKPEEDDSDEDEYEDQDEDGDGDGDGDGDEDQEDARDSNGKRFVDGNGHGMVRICGGEDTDEVEVKQEMDELARLDVDEIQQHGEEGLENDQIRSGGSLQDTLGSRDRKQEQQTTKPRVSASTPKKTRPLSQETALARSPTSPTSKPPATNINPRTQNQFQSPTQSPSQPSTNTNTTTVTTTIPNQTTNTTTTTTTNTPKMMQTCQICTTLNLPNNPTCTTCSHVLDPRKDPRSWRCESEVCIATNNNTTSSNGYVNAGDCGVCGICGVRRRRTSTAEEG